MAPEETDRYLTVAEVAERLRLHPITVRRHIKAGRIRAVRIGRAVRVPGGELQVFADAHAKGRQTIVAESRASYETRSPPKLPYRWPPTAKEKQRLRNIVERMRARRDKMNPLGMTTTELIRQGREELEQRADRILGLDR